MKILAREWIVTSNDWASKFLKRSDAVSIAQLLKGKLTAKETYYNGSIKLRIIKDYSI